MKRFMARNSPLVILIGLCLALAARSPEFRSPDNLVVVAQRTCDVGIMSIGQTVVIITGGIDLSVGSVAALSGVVAARVMKALQTPEAAAAWTSYEIAILGFLAACVTGMLCGFVNGALTTRGRIPAFIVTLGMMMAARGGAQILSSGQPISGLPKAFYWFGGTRGWYIPVGMLLVIAVLFAILLFKTRMGRGIFATGGNLQGARLSGLNTNRIRTIAFTLCGLLAGVAGAILTSRTSIATPNAAESYELSAIAACVIGGASLMGGEGGIIGSIAGALIMSVLDNFCNLRNIDVYWQRVVVGALIVAMVYYDGVRKRRAGLLKE